MRIITRGEAMRIHQQHPASRLFPFCTGKYRWHGSAEAYTGREVIRRQLVLPTRANYTGRTLQCDIKSRL
ncbi:DUF987 family protein, partial [Shigella sonnei]